MDPQPAPPLSAAASSPHLVYADSVDSSPRSRNTDSWDEPLPPIPGAKLRLMCSYGGHIVPRPHDKSLCYVGGDTRIVVVDRHSSLPDFTSRLSKTLLNGRPFTLKYQLPNEDLDSLISVTTDEDLDNMIEEYDRTTASTNAAAPTSTTSTTSTTTTTTTTNSSLKPYRLRLFLFPLKPDSASSIGSLLDNSTKTEDWFLSALNGSGILSRGFSDSASVNCLLGLDDDGVGSTIESLSRDVEAQPESFGNSKVLGKQGGQDVHSVPDSPMMETTSSFGSASSSPLLANLPPIRVHVEDGGGGGGVRFQDQKVGFEEQFSQMSVGGGGVQKQDEGFVVMSSPVTIAAPTAVPAFPMSEYQNRVFSDDERSEHGMPVGFRKPSQPQSLPSPDSVSSDSSISNAMSRPKPMLYQDPVVQIPSGTNRVSANPVDPKINISDPNSRAAQIQQQVQDSGYVLQSQFDQQQQQQPPQQQFYHAGTHYIHQGQVPMPSYYPLYPSQQQHQLHHHQQMDQQYPVYFMPARQPQAYNLSVQQSNFSEAAAAVPSSRPQTPPNPVMVNPPAAYNPTRNAPPHKPEMAAGVYRTAAAAAPQLVQMPSSQHQQQYVGFSQIHHPSQSIAPASAATANYAYEFADPAHAQQIYYTQPLAPSLHSQYQTMTSAPAMVLPEASAQLTTDNIKQQMRT